MSLNIGGAEKSLVNLLNMIDYKQYSVDLLLFQRKGAFLKQIPNGVRVIEIPEITILFQSAWESLKSKDIIVSRKKLILDRYLFSALCKIKWKQFDQIRLNRWLKYYTKLIPQNKKVYDVAIAYAGGECAYYMFDKVNAKKKVYYFHSDYSRINIDVELEKNYVDKSDLIVTISDKCKESLIELFPEVSDRIVVLQNLSSEQLIKNLSNEYYPSEFEVDCDVLKIVSVGRLINIKGYDMAIKAADILKQKSYKFIWVVVGEGNERKKLEQLIQKYKVSECFKLIGLRENPYPYIKNADVLLQTSRFEGKSVVLDEAKILKTPIIATNYNSVNDQIKNNYDGLITNMTPEAIAEGITRCSRENLNFWKKHMQVSKDICNIDYYMNILTGDK